MATYSVIRYYAAEKHKNKVIKTGLTRDEAKEHCNDKESSSRTATSPESLDHTERYGYWFDGFIEVQAGNLVAVRGEDHRDEPASGCDFEVDPRLKQDGVLEQRGVQPSNGIKDVAPCDGDLVATGQLDLDRRQTGELDT